MTAIWRRRDVLRIAIAPERNGAGMDVNYEGMFRI
jgi:hypothetical protein